MENDTEAVSDVFVLSLSLFVVIALFSSTLSVIFRRYCLSFCVCHIQSASLSPSHTHTQTFTYKHRVITSLQGTITTVIQGFYMVAWF